MEKTIIKLSYWLGIFCVGLAAAARAVNILGPDSLHFMTRGNPIGYHSFLDAAVLLFLIAIATASYLSSKS